MDLSDQAHSSAYGEARCLEKLNCVKIPIVRDEESPVMVARLLFRQQHLCMEGQPKAALLRSDR